MNPAALPMGMFGLAGARKPAEPFMWGRGGKRMSIDDIELKRRMAAQEMAEAGSGAPVQHWLQGLNRSLGAVTGGLRMQGANRADEQRKAEAKAATDAEIAALLANSGNKEAVLRAYATGSEGVQSVAKLLAEPMFAKPAAPHYWETNDGSLGMVGPDGQPVVLYKDPTPKVDWIRAENGDGTVTLTPMVNGQPAGGGGQASGASAGPPATLPPDFFDDDKGGAGASRVGSNFLDGL